eukprot:2290966-Prymnesium_polylepis.2
MRPSCIWFRRVLRQQVDHASLSDRRHEQCLAIGAQQAIVPPIVTSLIATRERVAARRCWSIPKGVTRRARDTVQFDDPGRIAMQGHHVEAPHVRRHARVPEDMAQLRVRSRREGCARADCILRRIAICRGCGGLVVWPVCTKDRQSARV